MPRYPSMSFGKSRYQIEAEQSTDPDHLDKLADHSKSNFVHSAIAANTQTRPATLERLAESDSKWTRKAVAKNPNTPHGVLMTLSHDPLPEVRAAVGYNSATPNVALAALARDLAPESRIAAAWNHSTSPDDLGLLAQDPDQNVRVKVAKNPATPDQVLLLLIADSTEKVRDAVANRNYRSDGPTRVVTQRRFDGRVSRNVTMEVPIETGGRFSAELMHVFARSSDAKTQFRVASQPDAPQDALAHLAQTTTIELTLKIIAENAGASAPVLHAVAERLDSDSLKAVATHPASSNETLTTIALSTLRSAHRSIANARPGGLEWLAAHTESKVRLVAAKHISGYTGSLGPDDVADLARRLLHDVDGSVQVAAAKSAPIGLVEDFLSHDNPQVRKVIAERTGTSQALGVLADDSVVIVRRAVAKNAHASMETLTLLSSDRDEKVRTSAGEQFLRALSSNLT